MQRSPFLIKKGLLNKEKKLLRTLLQKNPLWLSGHLKLAHSELNQILLVDQGLDPRALGTIRISAELIKEYCINKNFPSAHHLYLEASYFEAMYSFLNRNHQLALEIFRKLLLPENAIQLCREMHYRVLENAGLSASVVSSKEEALKYFSRIPGKFGNRQLIEAISK